MMRGLLTLFVLCISAFMQVELYVVTVDNLFISPEDSPIVLKMVDKEDYDNEFYYNDVYSYEVTFNFSNEDEQDIPLEYMYKGSNNNLVDKGVTSLCSANLSTVEGTVAAVVAMTLGITNDPVCPVQESTMTQKSVFIIQGGNFSNLPDSEDENDILSVKLNVYGSIYMSMELSITDDEFWFEDDAEDPDETTSADESQDNNEE